MPPYPISAPLAARRRCLNALRYLVRSYVTRPTTMSAITEIPAKTPRPMGSTSNFLPGTETPEVEVVGALSLARVPLASFDADEVVVGPRTITG